MARRRKKADRRTTLRVTLAGWLFLLISLLVGLAAVRSQMPLMFVLFGAMLGGMAVSSMIARGMVIAAGVHRELPTRAWQFEAVYFGYFLRNRRRRAPCLGLALHEIAPKGVENAYGYCVHLPGRGAFRAGCRLSAENRGRVDLQGVRLATKFPFGLVMVKRDVEQPASLVVWPAKGRIKSNLFRRGALEASSAPPSRLQGGQDEFFGLREYRPGDSPRWIHWRRSAGRETPVVREMAHPVPDVLFLVLDTRLDKKEVLSEWQRERMLRFAATLIDQALMRGFQVGMAMAGADGPRVFSPAMGVGARTGLLDALADVSGEEQTPFRRVVEAIPVSAVHNAQTFLLTEDRESISPAVLVNLGRSARHLEVIGPTDLDGIFEDHPLVQPRETPCP
ncbi:MAG: DUF58 domain-containing protein [Phycisphaerae bacterium]|nr:DUF58 domain-containing protein [Phycisphaerae bacterium]